MQNKVRQYIEKHHMIEQGELVAVGVSGGADSVCLLLVLRALCEQMHFRMMAIHVEHGIRGEESLRDQRFVEQLCEKLHVPLSVRHVDAPVWAAQNHKTLEEAARELRYQAFVEICEKKQATKLAAAHHGDDNAETVLFHLVRGTGIRGLCGIPAKRKLTDRVTLIRPMLGVTREEIEEYLAEEKQQFCTDSTNLDCTYTRNRIRGNVIPELTKVNEGAVKHITQSSEYLTGICDLLDRLTNQAMTDCVTSLGMDRIQIQVAELKKTESVIAQNLLHQLLGELAGTKKDITAGHIDSVLALTDTQVGKKISLPYDMVAFRTYEELVLVKDKNEPFSERHTESESEFLLDCNREITLPGGTRIRAQIENFGGNSEQISAKTYTKCFDYDKIKSTVLIRKRRSGDFFQVDEKGGHKKLKDYLINEKVPQRQRDEIWLLADGSHVLWAVGYRISEAYKVDSNTKTILRVQVLGGNDYDE